MPSVERLDSTRSKITQSGLRRLVIWCGLALCASIFFLVWLDDGSRARGLVATDCWFDVPAGLTVDCYRLSVPETRTSSLRQRADGATRNLRLPVVIVRGQILAGSAPQADPVVYLAGGPGDGAWVDPERITWWWDFIAGNDWIASRDLILFDQRGSGLVDPRMDCPDATEIAMRSLGLADDAAALAVERTMAAACAERAQALGFDPAAYTSVDNAEDLHDLFTALQVPRWNVYGLSYGTRLALEYMRRHPDDIRSVILDSALPPQARFFEDDAANTARAFQQLFDGCDRDRSCRLAYRELGDRLLALVERLDRQPLVVERPNPLGGGSLILRITGARLVNRFFSRLYNRADIEVLPQLIDIYDRNMADEIAYDLDLYLLELAGREDFGDAMFLSVQCFEEIPFNDMARARAAYARYPLVRNMAASGEAGSYGEICRVWREANGVREIRASDNEPVVSDVPTLILAGAYDPVTPPAYGRMTAKHLSRGHFIEFPGIGHDALGNDACANLVAADFLADPATPPRTACLEEASLPSFEPPVP